VPSVFSLPPREQELLLIELSPEPRRPSAFPVGGPASLGERAVVESPTWTKGLRGQLVLWAGWLLPQILLLGPALVGQTVDLPVDLLAHYHAYLPDRPEYEKVLHHGRELFDLVALYPEAREFATSELRAGRLPLWQPANYAGAPFTAWPTYSPFELLYYVAPRPVTLAWMALVQAVTVGLGMWLFLSRALRLSYWPAALGSWCAPLTGFITVWHGALPLGAVLWLPWLLLAVHSAIQRPSGFGGIGVALVTALMLLSGHPGMGGLVLLTTGFYFLWLLASDLCADGWWKGAASSGAVVGVGWLIGFLIAAPYLLPLLEYGRTGVRMQARTGGYDERPPEGIEGIPAILWPEVNGGETHANTSRTTNNSSLTEGASGAYAGLLAALWLAPLAWRDRRLRAQTIFWTLLVSVSLGWTLNVPGLVDLLQSKPLRPLASLSFNRWVFATADAILILAAIGLESLLAGAPKFRWRWLIPMALLGAFCGWCLFRFLTLTPELRDQGFARCFLLGAAVCVAGLGGWATTFSSGPRIKWVRVGLICLLPAELLWFAWCERRQADPALYFPRVAVLEKLATLPPGRVWGVNCLPPNLNQVVGLEDVRGYDGVDPGEFIRLFELAVNRDETDFISYARTQYALPAVSHSDRGTARLHPAADLLNVRYLILREKPKFALPVILQEDDYWIAENREALPRAFVPRKVRVVKDDDEALARIAPFDFDPRRTALVNDELRLPDEMRGTASVRYGPSSRVELEVDMQTPGLVVLSDLWDGGWRATLDGAACPIYRVDVALRGFRVPEGKHQIVCIYDPQSVQIGFRAAGIGGFFLLAWTIWKLARRPGTLPIGSVAGPA
jgi:hypothetical protein